jgi:superfamily II DNA/RNA helicase
MQVRDKFHIICEGDNLAPPVLQFEEMRMPKSIIRYLETKNIRRPTPIQMQANACLLLILGPSSMGCPQLCVDRPELPEMDIDRVLS